MNGFLITGHNSWTEDKDLELKIGGAGLKKLGVSSKLYCDIKMWVEFFGHPHCIFFAP